MDYHRPQILVQMRPAPSESEECLNLAVAVFVEALQVEAAEAVEEWEKLVAELSGDEGETWLPVALARGEDVVVLFEFNEGGD